MPSSTLSPGAPTAPSRAPTSAPLFLFVILAAQLMVVLDTTIVNVALPHMQQAFGFSASTLSWVLNAYILTFGGFLLLGARAGDLLGRRKAFLAGIAVFTLSSLVGGIAPWGWMLLGARAVQGVGAALAAPSSLSLLTSVFREGPQRVRAIGLYTTVSAAGGATGLVAGGLLTELVSWRWVMFVNVPIGLVIWLLGRSVLVETEVRHGRFDLIGAITSTLGMTGIVLGLVEAGTRGWTDPVTLVAFTAGVALLTAFVRNERRVEEPILPLRLLAHATRTTANVSRGLLYAGMYGMFFFMGQFLQDVQGFTPLKAGLAFLPMPAAVFAGSQLTSRVLTRRMPEKFVMAAGIGLGTVGLVMAATTVAVSMSYWAVAVSLILVGTGVGIAFVSLTSASLADVEPEDAGAASGLINVTQQLGAAVGLAVLVTVFGSATDGALVGTEFVHGLHAVYWVGALFTVSALALVAIFVRRPATAPELEGIDDDLDSEPAWLVEATADVA